MDCVGRYVNDNVVNACSCFVTNLFHYLSPCFAIVCIVVEDGNGIQSKRIVLSVFVVVLDHKVLVLVTQFAISNFFCFFLTKKMMKLMVMMIGPIYTTVQMTSEP